MRPKQAVAQEFKEFGLLYYKYVYPRGACAQCAQLRAVFGPVSPWGDTNIRKNGSGKTTLLETLYMLYRGTSFRGRDRDMIGHDKDRAEIRIVFDSGEERRMSLVAEQQKASKEFVVDGKKFGPFAEPFALTSCAVRAR